MFIDTASVKIKAGDGGDGAVSFRHEKFVDRGGPDGGDGGDGGDVVFVASRNQNTLSTFRFQKLLAATPGMYGTKRNRHGKSGEDLLVHVPVGTIIKNTDSEVLVDLTEDGQKTIIAKGGQGGFGNAHFVSSRRQTPKVAEKGEKGEDFELNIELKMIADVGLVGLPNAGKSTFLASVSNARPEIADYPFTTLKPNLGVADIGSDSLLMADIPGLIEGASKGKGLGDEFLRHVERTAVLLHLVDSYNDDVAKAYTTIQNELKAYQIDLSNKKQIVALTKIEGLDDEIIADKTKQLKKVVPKKSKLVAISSSSKQGVKGLLFELAILVKKHREVVLDEEEVVSDAPVLRLNEEELKEAWTVVKEGKKYIVSGAKIERFAAKTDFDNYYGVQRLRDIMKKLGILHELRRKGIKAGDKIKISGYSSIEY